MDKEKSKAELEQKRSTTLNPPTGKRIQRMRNLLEKMQDIKRSTSEEEQSQDTDYKNLNNEEEQNQGNIDCEEEFDDEERYDDDLLQCLNEDSDLVSTETRQPSFKTMEIPVKDLLNKKEMSISGTQKIPGIQRVSAKAFQQAQKSSSASEISNKQQHDKRAVLVLKGDMAEIFSAYRQEMIDQWDVIHALYVKNFATDHSDKTLTKILYDLDRISKREFHLLCKVETEKTFYTQYQKNVADIKLRKLLLERSIMSEADLQKLQKTLQVLHHLRIPYTLKTL